MHLAPHSEMIVNFASAGSAACFADLMTFPLDTAKVRLQIQGKDSKRYRGMVGTLATISRQEGPKALYNGLVAGLQRQLCFASIRIGFYDTAKTFYGGVVTNGKPTATQTFIIRICAGLTTGGAAVLFAQPTDVVKVRMQAQGATTGGVRYTSCLNAYHTIATKEGLRGLWSGTGPNVARNAIVNVSEIVCYDIIKTSILNRKLMADAIPCHFVSAVAAGFCTTVVASPVDVVKTRVMNGSPGQFKGVVDCATRMYREGGVATFYKGFMPSFYRMVSWNIVMWISYEQIKVVMTDSLNNRKSAIPL